MKRRWLQLEQVCPEGADVLVRFHATRQRLLFLTVVFGGIGLLCLGSALETGAFAGMASCNALLGAAVWWRGRALARQMRGGARS